MYIEQMPSSAGALASRRVASAPGTSSLSADEQEIAPVAAPGVLAFDSTVRPPLC